MKMNSEKFKDVPIEEDTRVFSRTVTTLGAYDALHEKWGWELNGITGESLILLETDVAALTDRELEHALRASSFIQPGSQVTITRNRNGFTFLNFNFIAGGGAGELEPVIF